MTGERIGPGIFVPVVGPSGAGKDSLIAIAREHFAGDDSVVFARRVVTRPSDPSAESHDTLDEAAFHAAEAAGAYALSWRSHGLCYGIPDSIDDTIRAGGIVVANTSRALIGQIEARYANVAPVLVTISAEMLAARLGARNRESATEIEGRIARNDNYAGFGEHCHAIDNSGPLNETGARFIRLLCELVV